MRQPVSTRTAGGFGGFRRSDWSGVLLVLIALLVLVLLTGGTSRYDTPHLMLLRPLAIVAAGFALTTFGWVHWRAYRSLWLLCGAIVLLLVAQLVPLPPALWQALPGREIVVQVDTLTGLGEVWRPLSLFPEGTWNALYALSVPAAVLLLGAQLTEAGRVRLLTVVLLLGLASGLVGVIQAAGTDLRFYRIATENAGLFANRNHQAALLACLFPLLAAWALVPVEKKGAARARHIVAGIVALLLIPLIVVTGSRMGLVVAGVAFLFSCAMLLFPQRRGHTNGWARVAQLALILAAGAAMVLATVHVSRDEALTRLGNVSSEARWPIWESMAGFIPHYLPFGTGAGTFVPVYQIHERDDLLMPAYVNQAHNDWLDLVLTSGVPGIVIALAALVLVVSATRRAFATRGLPGHLRQAGIGIMVVLAFASLSDYPVRTPILSALLAVAAVWAFAPYSEREAAESKRTHAQA